MDGVSDSCQSLDSARAADASQPLDSVRHAKALAILEVKDSVILRLERELDAAETALRSLTAAEGASVSEVQAHTQALVRERGLRHRAEALASEHAEEVLATQRRARAAEERLGRAEEWQQQALRDDRRQAESLGRMASEMSSLEAALLQSRGDLAEAQEEVRLLRQEELARPTGPENPHHEQLLNVLNRELSAARLSAHNAERDASHLQAQEWWASEFQLEQQRSLSAASTRGLLPSFSVLDPDPASDVEPEPATRLHPHQRDQAVAKVVEAKSTEMEISCTATTSGLGPTREVMEDSLQPTGSPSSAQAQPNSTAGEGQPPHHWITLGMRSVLDAFFSHLLHQEQNYETSLGLTPHAQSVLATETQMIRTVMSENSERRQGGDSSSTRPGRRDELNKSGLVDAPPALEHDPAECSHLKRRDDDQVLPWQTNSDAATSIREQGLEGQPGSTLSADLPGALRLPRQYATVAVQTSGEVARPDALPALAILQRFAAIVGLQQRLEADCRAAAQRLASLGRRCSRESASAEELRSALALQDGRLANLEASETAAAKAEVASAEVAALATAAAQRAEGELKSEVQVAIEAEAQAEAQAEAREEAEVRAHVLARRSQARSRAELALRAWKLELSLAVQEREWEKLQREQVLGEEESRAVAAKAEAQAARTEEELEEAREALADARGAADRAEAGTGAAGMAVEATRAELVAARAGLVESATELRREQALLAHSEQKVVASRGLAGELQALLVSQGQDLQIRLEGSEAARLWEEIGRKEDRDEWQARYELSYQEGREAVAELQCRYREEYELRLGALEQCNAARQQLSFFEEQAVHLTERLSSTEQQLDARQRDDAEDACIWRDFCLLQQELAQARVREAALLQELDRLRQVVLSSTAASGSPPQPLRSPSQSQSQSQSQGEGDADAEADIADVEVEEPGRSSAYPLHSQVHTLVAREQLGRGTRTGTDSHTRGHDLAATRQQQQQELQQQQQQVSALEAETGQLRAQLRAAEAQLRTCRQEANRQRSLVAGLEQRCAAATREREAAIAALRREEAEALAEEGRLRAVLERQLTQREAALQSLRRRCEAVQVEARRAEAAKASEAEAVEAEAAASARRLSQARAAGARAQRREAQARAALQDELSGARAELQEASAGGATVAAATQAGAGRAPVPRPQQRAEPAQRHRLRPQPAHASAAAATAQAPALALEEATPSVERSIVEDSLQILNLQPDDLAEFLMR